ncbi:hypothetical protein HDU76_009228, partial [Blyttiomyces sp. JEL0837]
TSKLVKVYYPTDAEVADSERQAFATDVANNVELMIYNNTRLNNPSSASIPSIYPTDLEEIASAVQTFAVFDVVMKGY